MANENMIKFLRGNVADLPQTATAGALYFTKDEGVYLGLENGSYHRYGDFITVADVDSLPTTGAHATCMYYCTSENILARYDAVKGWIQINKQPTAEEMKTLLGLGSLAYKSEVAEDDLNADLAAKINTVAEGNHSHANKELLDTYTQTEADLADAVAKKHSHSFADEAALNGITATKVADWDDAVSKEHTHTFADTDVEDAISKKHSHTFVESELNKIAAGDVAKWNGVVADHLVAADKTALEDSIGDVNTALENYKTSNNEALAGVKATAEAAATKEYTDAELAKKVAKTDYEADKATFATKTELNGVDAKFANYKTAADQKAIDDAQDIEIGKKVDKVEGKSLVDNAEITKLAGVSEGANKVEKSNTNGNIKVDGEEVVVYTHPATHTVSEISDFDEKVKAYDYATKTEAQGYADAKDEAIAAAKKAGDDAQADVDALEAYVGIFTASEGVDTVVKYIDAKTANIASDERVNGIENRVKAIEDDYLVEADKTELANAIAAEKERAEGIEGGLRTDVDAIKADYLKAADKEALQTQINTIMNNPDAEGAINSINEFTQYVADHGTIADGFRTDIDKNKENIAANAKAITDEAARADAAEKALAGRLDTLEAIDHEAYKGYADQAEADAKAYADAEVAKDRERLVALEAIDHNYAGADATLKAELQAEIDSDVKALADGAVATNASNIADIMAMLTWGTFGE